MTKIVNSLSAKLEIGNPMACMYLLGYPDHYTNFKFRPLYWQGFVREARKPWVPEGDPTCNSDPKSATDKVAIYRHNGRIVGLSPVHVYIFRAEEIQTMCLYDWVSRCEREKLPKHKKDAKPRPCGVDEDYSETESTCTQKQGTCPSQSPLLAFQHGHPLADSTVPVVVL